MSQPTLAGFVSQDTAPHATRVIRVRDWLRSMGHSNVPPKILDVLAWCDSAAELRFAWVVANLPGGQALGDRTLVLDDVTLELQYAVGSYRIDCVAHVTGFSLAIEIDGMPFHHATDEQVAADNLRQRRVIARTGFPVVRFTAREALTQPEECWRQVAAILDTRRRVAALREEAVAHG